eukprot:m.303161 g.303161  ORF g.303161 m.303161 type:complete len:321 (-) comp15721_c0_seq1:105-1067(-)
MAEETCDTPEISAIRPVVKPQFTLEGAESMAVIFGVSAADGNTKPDGGSASSVSKRQLQDPLDAFILDGVCTLAECEAMRSRADALSYTFWNMQAPEQRAFRNADTVEVTDQGLADALWTRIKAHVVPEVVITPEQARWERGLEGTWRAFGVNPQLLFVRYGPGGHFSPHTDGYTVLDFNNRSLYSMLVYLNDCPTGGATRLMNPPEKQEFVTDDGGRFRWPEAQIIDKAPVDLGTCLLFYQNLPHEGEPVGDGCEKYIIRTDVLYTRTPPILTEPNDLEAYRLYREAELLEADGKPTEAMKMFRRCARLSPGLADIYGL